MNKNTAPYVVGSDTSEAAARSILVDSGQLREFVFGYFERAGARGMTCDEIEVETQMKHQTVSPRMRELAQMGRIVDSGKRRPTRSSRLAAVWIVKDPTSASDSALLPNSIPSAVSTPVPTSSSADSVQSTLLSQTMMDPVGEEGLAGLRRRCLDCHRCDLSKTRNKVVFGEGNIHEPPVCFVGEAPGAVENDIGRPFVGKAGQFLDRVISAMKLKREEVYILNSVACRPPDNRSPAKKELDACFEYLVGQLRAVRPKTIVALGGTAVAAFFGGQAEITKLRGKWLEWEGIPLMPTFHPSFLLRKSFDRDTGRPSPDFVDLKKLMWSDMQQVLHKLGRS
jgi:uracil-DNA glycosylase family 4